MLSQSHSSLSSAALININGNNSNNIDKPAALHLALGPITSSWSAPNSLGNGWSPSASPIGFYFEKALTQYFS